MPLLYRLLEARVQALGPLRSPETCVQAHGVLKKSGDEFPYHRRDAASVGLAVSDYSDLLHVRFSPDPGHRNPENLEAVVKVVRTVAEWVQTTLRAGDMPEARRGALREVGRHPRGVLAPRLLLHLPQLPVARRGLQRALVVS